MDLHPDFLNQNSIWDNLVCLLFKGIHLIWVNPLFQLFNRLAIQVNIEAADTL